MGQSGWLGTWLVTLGSLSRVFWFRSPTTWGSVYESARWPGQDWLSQNTGGDWGANLVRHLGFLSTAGL